MSTRSDPPTRRSAGRLPPPEHESYLTRRLLRRFLVAGILIAVLTGVLTGTTAHDHHLTAAAMAGSVTISPLPDTPDASPATQISFLGVSPGEISRVDVVGDESGTHAGRLESYSTGTGASFVLARPLTQGEHVRVSAQVDGHAVSTYFSVARWVTYDFNQPTPPPASSSSTVQSFMSAPDLHPPAVDVTTDAPGGSPGDVFTAPNNGAGQWGPMIFNRSGQLVWFDPMPAGMFAMNFHEENYEGSPDLVWWQGYIADIGVGYGADEIYNSHYQKVAQVRAGNGYQADLHELDITPQGTAFITAYTLVQANLSSVGGASDGVLLDPIVQEIDIKTGLVMFEWDALGHITIKDSYVTVPHGATPWDWFHLNSISLGPDGTILVDARNTWAAYDVSLRTGRVLWQLGGRQTSFKMGTGTTVAYQHDAEWQPDEEITIFDDGASPNVHTQSRAITVRIDPASHRVSLINQLEHTPALLTASQGNDQVLPNGGSFVGWGQDPYFTEFSPTGRTLFDAHFPVPGQTYRAYLLPWSGTPTGTPAVAAESTGSGTATVYASWNGATDVSVWRVLVGSSAADLSPITQSSKNGFETAIPIATNEPMVEVQALGRTGNVIGTSPAVDISSS
ncbi:MAG TPA: arylsulfotransferase family protein [Solirubrobacteraceae bacterium]|nr:arylsulfotransferase family protein [Solirubrobacteraceae bacterium]